MAGMLTLPPRLSPGGVKAVPVLVRAPAPFKVENPLSVRVPWFTVPAASPADVPWTEIVQAVAGMSPPKVDPERGDVEGGHRWFPPAAHWRR